MAATRKTLREEYFDWLYDHIDNQSRSYRVLCRELHRVNFRWSVHNDDNRVADGLLLRERFIEKRGIDPAQMEVSYFLKGGECSVLEVLVGLSQRMDEIMCPVGEEVSRCGKWFQELIMNLRLAEFTDREAVSDRFEEMAEQKILAILDTWMDRTYDFYGVGGLFPLKRRPRQDQRTAELWYQMMYYLTENYGY